MNQACNETSTLPGCHDSSCEELICIQLPTCCNETWNDDCAILGGSLCRPLILPRPEEFETCPLGFICSETSVTHCLELQETLTDFYQVGNLMGGIYCAEGEDKLKNCDLGHFCPTPDVQSVCPDGYFCPHKTQTLEEDAFECRRCDEGSREVVREPYGFVLLWICVAISIAYILTVAIKRYRRDLFDHLADLQKRQTDSLLLAMSRSKRNEQLERLRPKLEILSSRLAKLAEEMKPERDSLNLDYIDCLVISQGEENKKIKFDANKMFDILDEDHDQVLTYEEINKVLSLNRVELHAFVRRMDELDTTIQLPDAVTRRTFVKYFIDVLEETTHFTVSPEEAGKIFDEIGEQASGSAGETRPYVMSQDLYTSSLSNFLTDIQINELIKKFRHAKHLKRMESIRGEAEASRDDSERGPRRTMSRANLSRDPDSNMQLITRQEFIVNYPKFLVDVLLGIDELQSVRPHEGIQGLVAGGEGIDLCFEKLSLEVNVGGQTVNVVNDVTGRLCSGTMTALMGGSGAGKTSLLNSLCGRAYYGETTGTIMINGQEASIDSIKDQVGFVPQDDIVYAELTVLENLMFSGKFRLPKGTPDEAIEELAESTLANLGLSRVANSPVGDVHRRGVSGGEKKRVNIGLELMACPQILFLDEPTSGLDSSSALLVMSSLKHLVDVQNVTVVSVIHQPRKFIFDLFDGLILLGVGGNLVYHGPTSDAKQYFNKLGYILPEGESVADWLIDISSGTLEPDNKPDDDVDNGDDDDDDDVGAAGLLGSRVGPGGKQQQAAEVAKTRREWLYQEWREHFDKMEPETKKERYLPPEQTELPSPTVKAKFFEQFVVQLKRAVIVANRNRYSKFIDTCITMVALIIISFLDGTTNPTRDLSPDLDFAEATRPNEDNAERFLSQLFRYAVVDQWLFPLEVGVIVAILIGLQALKITTTKRVEFFREAATTDISAYFLAINVVATVEHSIQIVVAAFFVTWLRNPLANWLHYYTHFLLLTWIVVSWALLFPQIMPADNVVIGTGFFFAFFGLLFGGVLPPTDYPALYDNAAAGLFSGWLSPPRYFIEAMQVGEFRCMPEQSGWTVDEDAVNFPRQYSAFGVSRMAGSDINVTIQSCGGWYWAIWPSIMVGLTVRFIAFGCMHLCNRNKQIKKPLGEVMKKYPKVKCYIALYSFILAVLIIATSLLMFREPTVDESIQESVSIHDQAEQLRPCVESGECSLFDLAECVEDESGQCTEDPLTLFIESSNSEGLATNLTAFDDIDFDAGNGTDDGVLDDLNFTDSNIDGI